MKPKEWELRFVNSTEGGQVRSIKSGPFSEENCVVKVIEKSAYEKAIEALKSARYRIYQACNDDDTVAYLDSQLKELGEDS